MSHIIKATLIAALCSASLMACGQSTPKAKNLYPAFTAVISKPTTNANLSSGSGIIVDGNKIKVVGDDVPWLFTVNSQFIINQKSFIVKLPLAKNHRLPKAIKPDFENLTKIQYKGKPYYLTMGSGSQSMTRENLYLLTPQGAIKQQLPLHKFYEELHKVSGLGAHQTLNIEAVANTKDNIFIFNRNTEGKNVIFKLPIQGMLDYLQGSKLMPPVTVYPVKLPILKGVHSGLSGADYWTQRNSFVISASVKDTSNAMDDGAILGSFIGVIPLEVLTANKPVDLTPYMQRVTHDGKTLITKVEGVAIATSTNKKASGYLISDNDNGKSQFFDFSIHQNLPK